MRELNGSNRKSGGKARIFSVMQGISGTRFHRGILDDITPGGSSMSQYSPEASSGKVTYKKVALWVAACQERASGLMVLEVEFCGMVRPTFCRSLK
jgi:hypothetical protein